MNYTDPHWSNSALITIDVQNDFVRPGAPAEIASTANALPAMRTLLDAYRAAGRPIIHVVRLYRTDGSNVDLCRKALIEGGGRVVAPGSFGAELSPELLPEGAPALDAELLLSGGFQPLARREWAMYKPRWGAFYGTDLEAFLRELGVDTLVFCGCNFPNCPRTSIYEASERDFRCVLVPDAMSGVYEQGLKELRAIHVAIVGMEDACRLAAGR